jgi:hypothetical protein
VMPDVASCRAGDRKRLVQRLRHPSRLPEVAPGAARASVDFPQNAKSLGDRPGAESLTISGASVPAGKTEAPCDSGITS